jgi:hypothetical protein
MIITYTNLEDWFDACEAYGYRVARCECVDPCHIAFFQKDCSYVALNGSLKVGIFSIKRNNGNLYLIGEIIDRPFSISN